MMGWILAALVLGIFLNMTSVGGAVLPVGSVVATVIMGVYIKINQDRNFEEMKKLLEHSAKAEKEKQQL